MEHCLHSRSVAEQQIDSSYWHLYSKFIWFAVKKKNSLYMVETVKLLMHSLFTAWYHTTGGDET